MSYIYKILNTKNNKFYIGSSKDVDKRWYQHTYALNNDVHPNKHLQNAWNKYGEDSFVFVILEEVSDDKQFVIEQKYIDNLKPFNDVGYNIAKDVNDPFKGELLNKKCKECKKEFSTCYQNQKYCSRKCERIYNSSDGDWYPDWKLNRRIKESDFEDMDIGDWDVHDHIASWIVDQMEK